jgi:hypothetical protein
MTVHVTIALEADQLERADREARLRGISRETYLSHLVQVILSSPSLPAGDISSIFGIGASVGPTDIGRDKDAMIGEAVWKEHLRKTQKAS